MWTVGFSETVKIENRLKMFSKDREGMSEKRVCGSITNEHKIKEKKNILAN